MQLRKHLSPVTVPFPPTYSWPLLASLMLIGPFWLKSLLGHPALKVASYLSAVALCLLFLLLLSPTSSRKVWYKCPSSEILLVFSIDDSFIHPHSFIFTSPETLPENTSPILDFSSRSSVCPFISTPVPTFMYSPIIPYPGLVVRI